MEPYYADCLRRGFFYECACGEIFKNEKAAYNCRNCVAYLTPEEYSVRVITDIRTLDELKE